MYYLFDFDGTLVDSMPAYGGMMLRILDEHHTSYPDNIIKIITPLGFRYTARYFIEKLGLERTEEELMALMTAYSREQYATSIGEKPHVIETLRKMKARGDSLNVLTASPHTSLDPCLKRLGVWDLFDNVWSCEDFATTKSDPEIYRMAAARIGQPVERILFCDDNVGADKTAKSAGMPVCGVYDDSSAEFTDEMKQVCDFYAEDFSEIYGFEV